MNPGQLRHTVSIMRPVSDIATASGHYIKQPPETVATVKAAIKGVKNVESVQDGAERQAETIQITIRWRQGLETGMYAVWNGIRYDFERVEPTPYDGVYRRVWAKSVRGVRTAGAV